MFVIPKPSLLSFTRLIATCTPLIAAVLMSIVSLPVSASLAGAEQALADGEWSEVLSETTQYLDNRHDAEWSEAMWLRARALWKLSAKSRHRDQLAETLAVLRSQADLSPGRSAEVALLHARYQGLLLHDVAAAIDTMLSALQTIGQAEPDQHRTIRQDLHETLTHAYLNQGDYGQAQSHVEQAVALTEPDDPVDQIAYLLLTQGKVLHLMKQYNQAQAVYQRALNMLPSGSYPEREAQLNRRLGSNYLALSDHTQALTHLHNAADIYKQLGNQLKLAYVLDRLGDALFLSGDEDGAFIQYLNALELLQQQPDPSPTKVGLLYKNLGDIYVSKRQWQSALEYYRRAEQLLSTRPKQQSLINLYVEMSKVSQRLQQADAALAYAEKAVQQSEHTELPDYRLNALAHLANMYVASGELARALDLRQRQIQVLEAIPDKVVMPIASVDEIGQLKRQISAFGSQNEAKAAQIAQHILQSKLLLAALVCLFLLLLYTTQRAGRLRQQLRDTKAKATLREGTRISNAEAYLEYLNGELKQRTSALLRSDARLSIGRAPRQYLVGFMLDAVVRKFLNRGVEEGKAFERAFGEQLKALSGVNHLFQPRDNLFVLQLETPEQMEQIAAELLSQLLKVLARLGETVPSILALGIIEQPFLKSAPTAVEGEALNEILLLALKHASVETHKQKQPCWVGLHAKPVMSPSLLVGSVREGVITGLQKGYIRKEVGSVKQQQALPAESELEIL